VGWARFIEIADRLAAPTVADDDDQRLCAVRPIGFSDH